ncbi:MAG: hypothetical protein DME43_00895 [Verrucomicrobia bacterium]|nr:MAG: hypothetical protein DME43_00895 [Verrucomicrobiota bacterium]PYK72357.1 MAG: hypothetical protein DME44_04660 [Verrucomicrobiota bacterium]
MRILPETPTMIAGIPTDHLPVFERSVNAAIRCPSAGDFCRQQTVLFSIYARWGTAAAQEAIQNTAIIIPRSS